MNRSIWLTNQSNFNNDKNILVDESDKVEKAMEIEYELECGLVNFYLIQKKFSNLLFGPYCS